MESAKVPPGVRRPKKKQVKDELDRLKQAEKKKRRLEKALATSAAIRTELEEKKQKKKEEQQRLDEEGAAIAEAVALHVLLGEDSCEIMLNKDEGFRPWACTGEIDFFMGGRQVILPPEDLSVHSFEGIRWVSSADGSGRMWNEWGKTDLSVSSGPFLGDLCMPYSNERGWETTDICAGHIAAQAIASLQIAEDAIADPCTFKF